MLLSLGDPGRLCLARDGGPRFLGLHVRAKGPVQLHGGPQPYQAGTVTCEGKVDLQASPEALNEGRWCCRLCCCTQVRERAMEEVSRAQKAELQAGLAAMRPYGGQATAFMTSSTNARPAWRRSASAVSHNHAAGAGQGRGRLMSTPWSLPCCRRCPGGRSSGPLPVASGARMMTSTSWTHLTGGLPTSHWCRRRWSLS